MTSSFLYANGIYANGILLAGGGPYATSLVMLMTVNPRVETVARSAHATRVLDWDFRVADDLFDEADRWIRENVTGRWLWLEHPRMPKGARPRVRFYDEVDAIAFMARFDG